MRISLLLVLNGILSLVLLTSMFFGVSTSQQPFDPLRDVNGDGYVGIDDVVDVAEHFGSEGTPINWTQLVDDIDMLKTESTYTKWIRFYEPNETSNNDQYTWENATDFVWTPNNNTNNAILAIRCYFQYHCEGQGFEFRLMINNETTVSAFGYFTSIDYTQSPVYVYLVGARAQGYVKTFPNQENYSIKFQISPIQSLNVAYVKDINILVEVMDGLPNSN